MARQSTQDPSCKHHTQNLDQQAKGPEHKSSPEPVAEEYDEISESLLFRIVCAISDLSDKFHFPVWVILPYIIGIILYRRASSDLLPVWVETCYVLIELLLMRISYNQAEKTIIPVPYVITMLFYSGALMLVMPHLTGEASSGAGKFLKVYPWTPHIYGIAFSMILILIARSKRKRRKARRKKKG